MVAWSSLNNEHAGSLPGGPETPLGMCVGGGWWGGSLRGIPPRDPSPTMIYDLSALVKGPAAAGVVLLVSPKGADAAEEATRAQPPCTPPSAAPPDTHHSASFLSSPQKLPEALLLFYYKSGVSERLRFWSPTGKHTVE